MHDKFCWCRSCRSSLVVDSLSFEVADVPVVWPCRSSVAAVSRDPTVAACRARAWTRSFTRPLCATTFVWRFRVLKTATVQQLQCSDGEWGFFRPCTQVQGREACPQGHGPHSSMQALAFIDKDIRHTSRSAPPSPPPPPPHTHTYPPSPLPPSFSSLLLHTHHHHHQAFPPKRCRVVAFCVRNSSG